MGCSTVRPPTGDDATATVIARVLPEFRRRGIGTSLCDDAFAHAHSLGAEVVETVVLTTNHKGHRFATRLGFEEVERHLVHGHGWVTLRLHDRLAP